MRRITALVLGATLLASGCAAALTPLPTTICHEPLATEAGGETLPMVAAREVNDGEWIRLLTDDEEGRSTSCEQALFRAPPQPRRCGAAADDRSTSPLLPIPATIVARLDREGDDHLVWVATHRTMGGDHSGPVAIVRSTTLGLEVQALGIHTGPAAHAELRLLRTASAAVVAVTADHEGTRVADLLVQSGGALVAPALEEAGGSDCSGAARLILRSVTDEPQPDGWTRRVVRSAVLHESEAAIVVREHVTAREIDLRVVDAPARGSRDADRVRLLVPSGTTLSADRPSLSDVDADESERGTPRPRAGRTRGR